MGHDFHYVTYPVNNDNEPCNFIGVLKYKLTANELDNYDLFKGEGFIENELACKAEFNLVLPGEIRKYSLK